MIDVQDVRRVRWVVGAHVALMSLLLAVQAAHYGSMLVTWVVTWVVAVVAPAVGAEVGLRRLAKPQVASSTARQLLIAPLLVAVTMIVMLFEVIAKVSKF